MARTSPEPTRLAWSDKTTGLPCFARATDIDGVWCGYVGVPKGHGWHGRDYAELERVDVHGGLTYAGEFISDPMGLVSHVTTDGDALWWLGFDCGHFDDVTPAMHTQMTELGMDPPMFRGITSTTSPTLDFVRSECTRLAAQVDASAPYGLIRSGRAGSRLDGR